LKHFRREGENYLLSIWTCCLTQLQVCVL